MAVSSSTVTSGNEERKGVSFTGVMVTTKLRVTVWLVRPPSLTVTVTVTTPNALVAGINSSEPVAEGLA